MKVDSYETKYACPSQAADPKREPIAANMANFVTIEVRTDSGLKGIGYGGFVNESMLKPLKATMDALAQQTVGEDPQAVEAVGTKLLGFGGLGAPAGLVTSAAAAIDTALWDIKGKAAGLPLFRMLGSGSNRVPAYASGYLWRDYDAERLGMTGARLAGEGFRAMKFRMGAEPWDAEELNRMDCLRHAVGEEIDLMVDINQGWDVKRAIRMGREMEGQKLFWLEDPIDHQDFDGLRQIAEDLAISITAGEYLYGIQPISQMLAKGAVDILMVDLLRVGGITSWMKAAHLAEGWNKPVVSHLAPEILAHCVVAAPNGLIVEHMPWAFPLFKEVPAVEDGEIVLSERPGLGLEFDHAAIDKLQPRS